MSKTNDTLVSIIVPVYNVRKYLEQCLNSIVNQTYSNLEAILVDDGSTDGSSAICDKYEAKDKRFKSYHKINGGLSDARNYGIERAKGKYISFIDSDDYVSQYYIETLIQIIQQKKCSLVMGNYLKTTVNYKKQNKKSDLNKVTVYSRREAMVALLYHRKLSMYSCGKIYERSLFNDIRFPVGRLFEDIPTTWQIVKKVDYVGYIDEIIYIYRQRTTSIVGSQFSEAKVDAVRHSELILDDIGQDRELCLAAISASFFNCLDILAQIENKDTESYEYIIEKIRQYRKIVLTDTNNSIYLRVMALISCVSIALVRVIGKIYKKCKWLKWYFQLFWCERK